MSKTRVLIIEDEKDILRLLKYNLEKEGYQVVSATDGASGLAAAQKEKPDLLILDLMLPKLDGMEVCRTLRQESRVPILMLTAKKQEVDRILGLELGADDYVTKPFSIRELLARVKTILRRSQRPSPETGTGKFGDLRFDAERYTVSVKGKPVSLGTKEFAFLKILLEANGKALTRDQLLEKVWGYDRSMDIDTRTIDQHITRLRDKLGSEAKRVVTVKNVGYRFETQ
ncbi:MAG: DNA-binding response regulator [Elusimicrobia bacterium RIFCSPLOWO2_01_FULL_59_12]|nr:MAG: DNA-binding response regulator [Elusimicrobia bacterium RIFCSPLOWO2_01_FULL_59_12]